MVIQCSHCQARFKLADEKIKPEGTKVRCAKCREIFSVFPTPPAVEESPAPAVAVESQAPAAPAESDEFSFDISEIASTAPVAQPDTATPPPTAVASTFEPASTPISVPDELGMNALGTTGIEFSFEESTTPSPGLDSGAESANFSIETPDSADSDAFAFDGSDSSLPSLSFESSVTTATDEPSDFDFPAVPDTDSLTFDVSPSPEAASDEFSFDAGDNTPDFDTFSFDDQPNEAALPATDSFSFDQESAADFAWDDEAPPPALADTTQPATTSATAPTPAANEDFDFSSLSFDESTSTPEASLTAEPAPAVNPFASGPMSVAATTSQSSSASTGSGIALAHTESKPAPVEQQTPPVRRDPSTTAPAPSARSARPPVRRRNGFSLASLLKIVLIAGLLCAAGAGYYFWKTKGYTFEGLVSRFIERQAPVDTSGQITVTNITGSYVANRKEGNLFVIRGDAFNEYKGTRSTISVKGILYGPQGKILAEQVAFCGNIPSDETLQKADFTELANVMKNEFGDSFTNVNVAAGKAVPFTIIFRNIPKTLTEFTVEVVDSSPGSK